MYLFPLQLLAEKTINQKQLIKESYEFTGFFFLSLLKLWKKISECRNVCQFRWLNAILLISTTCKTCGNIYHIAQLVIFEHFSKVTRLVKTCQSNLGHYGKGWEEGRVYHCFACSIPFDPKHLAGNTNSCFLSNEILYGLPFPLLFILTIRPVFFTQ